MVTVERLAQVPFFRGMPAWALRVFAASALERTYQANEIIVHQHDQADEVMFLVEGSVQFLIRFQGIDDLLVGTHDQHGGVLGWSAFRIPYRYTASVRCEEPATVLMVPRKTFARIFEEDPKLGYVLLRRVTGALADRLEQTASMVVETRVVEREGKA